MPELNRSPAGDCPKQISLQETANAKGWSLSGTNFQDKVDGDRRRPRQQHLWGQFGLGATTHLHATKLLERISVVFARSPWSARPSSALRRATLGNTWRTAVCWCVPDSEPHAYKGGSDLRGTCLIEPSVRVADQSFHGNLFLLCYAEG
jgi:hypothetical protein